MSRRFHLSRRARVEIRNIYLVGIRLFGAQQASSYIDGLEHCLSLLADSPRMGRPAPRLGPNVRRHEHGSHVVLYREEAEGILVLAVVHGRSVRGLEL